MNKFILQVLNPAIRHLIDPPIRTRVGKLNLGSERVRRKTEDRTPADWNRIVQAQAKRQRRAQKRRLEEARRVAPSLVVPS